ncbi:MAG TPA: peptide chain release factor 2 [Geminicoccaceae bacterium]
MRAELANLADQIGQGLVLLRRHLDWDNALLRLEELNSLSEDPKLWDDSAKAQAIMSERNTLAAKVERQRGLERALEDAKGMAELAEEEGDETMIADVQAELGRMREQVDRLQLEAMLSGEADGNDAFVQVAAGAGGTESQDWAEMLLRMYLRWAEQHGHKVEWIEESAGEEAGIKSATIKVGGENAYGWLKTEAGVHRLVRISPFDGNARRHTSFASVSVSPVVDDRIQIEILDKDLKIDTYRASGAGGQHVNRTDSAVRITHMPTGLIAACQNDRSQHRNRAQAMDMLRAKLYELEVQKKRAESDALEAQKLDTTFGSQIRNYVLHPYRLVKDLRTGVESGNPQAVLDGDLDRFLEASLAQGAGSRRPESAEA